MKQDTDQPALKQLSLGLALLGLCLGCLAAYGVLTGDANGRVNLLFLLLLFAFLPVLGLLLSLLLMLKGGGKGLAGWILEIPLWPRHLVLALSQLTSSQGRQLWLFYQTQVVAVSFTLGCLLLYLLLLLGSDITFVWRSTLSSKPSTGRKANSSKRNSRLTRPSASPVNTPYAARQPRHRPSRARPRLNCFSAGWSVSCFTRFPVPIESAHYSGLNDE